MRLKAKKTPKFVNIAIIVLVAFFAIFGQLTGAYFTSQENQQNLIDLPKVPVKIYYGNEEIENSSFEFDQSKSISIKNAGNISAYARVKVLINCVDEENNILANYKPADYIEVEYSNFEVVNGYQQGFIYYYDDDAFVEMEAGDTVLLLDAENITLKEDLPEDVYLNISVFAELIQKDSSSKGLSRWQV